MICLTFENESEYRNNAAKAAKEIKLYFLWSHLTPQRRSDTNRFRIMLDTEAERDVTAGVRAVAVTEAVVVDTTEVGRVGSIR